MKLLSKTGEKVFNSAGKKKILPDSFDRKVKVMTPVLLKNVPELKNAPENPVVKKSLGVRKESGHWVIYNKVTGETLPQKDNNFKTKDQADSVIILASKAAYEKGGKTNKSNIMSDNTARIYVADLAAYNEGKLIGEWLDLEDYSSGSEVMDAINDLLKKWSKEQGQEREEYAIHDTENIPNSFYSESMGETEFDAYYEAKKVADDRDVPVDVLLEWMGDHGVDDPETAGDAYQGKYDDMEDFAYRMIEEGVISDTSDYISISDTDRRILAGEEADNEMDGRDDEDELIKDADMEDELQELEAKRDEEEGDEDSDFDFDEEKTKLAEKAKEKIRDERYDEIYNDLNDPVQYFVEDHGLYSKEDLAKASFVSVDYEALARDLSHDYTEVRYEGDSYIFSSNYSKGGTIKKEKGGPAITDDSQIKIGSKVTLKDNIIWDKLSGTEDKNSNSYKSYKKLQKLSGQTGEVYDIGLNVAAVEFPNGVKVTVIKDLLNNTSFASGGKPIGSTGLFARGGNLTAHEAKDTIIYVIEKGKVETTNLYDHVMASATEVTSPRGILNQMFVEEVKILEDGMEEPVIKWGLKDWGRNAHNRTPKIVELFDTEEEADNKCFRLHETYDFAKDDQRDTQYWHSKEDAEKELLERSADKGYASGGKPIGSTGLFEEGGKADSIPDIVKQAMIHPVTDIGQLSKKNLSDLNKYVNKGVLIKGKGGVFPKEKMVYAIKGFDIKKDREEGVKKMIEETERLEGKKFH